MNATNAESALKSYCKIKGFEKPVYQIVSKNSKMIDGKVFRYKYYVTSVTVNGIHLANGDGYSKRIAHMKAAMYGLQQLKLLELHQLFVGYKQFNPAMFMGSQRQHRLAITASTVDDYTDTDSDRSMPKPRANNDDDDEPSTEWIFQAIEKLKSFKDSDSEDDDVSLISSKRSTQAFSTGDNESLYNQFVEEVVQDISSLVLNQKYSGFNLKKNNFNKLYFHFISSISNDPEVKFPEND